MLINAFAFIDTRVDKFDLMKDLSLTTFLKIAAMPTTQGKLGVLSRMHNGAGGYDFYKRMKLAAREVARGEIPSEEILGKLANIKRASERVHNLQMATQFTGWWSSITDAVARPDRPEGVYKLAGMAFGIRLVPELVYSQSGEIYVTYLWAMNLPKLTKQIAGMGLYMLRSELAERAFKQAKFQFLNLRNLEMFGEDNVTNQTASLLNADISQINAIWIEVSQKPS